MAAVVTSENLPEHRGALLTEGARVKEIIQDPLVCCSTIYIFSSRSSFLPFLPLEMWSVKRYVHVAAASPKSCLAKSAHNGKL